MKTKLTLSIDKKLIELGKAFAKKNGMSLSQFLEISIQKAVESITGSSQVNEPQLLYVEKVSKEKKMALDALERLSGILNSSGDFDPDEERLNYLKEKYGGFEDSH